MAFERLEHRHLLAGDITIYAAGETGEETMELLIDGAVVRTWTNVAGEPGTRTFQPFTYSVGTSVTADRIRISFTNDYYVDGVTDRNLYVDKIVVDGTAYETEHPSVYSTGSWKPEDGIVPGYRESEVLNANGYFQYAALSTSGSTIRIRAAGSTGNENMSLLINDIQVASWTAIGGNADAGTFNEFVFTASSIVDAKQIKVAFTNDVYSPPVDYNLRVDSIQVDGVQYETEAPSTYSTGTYVAEQGGIVSGYWQSEWLHSNGYFQYAALSTSGSTIRILAAGSTGNENMSLLIDDVEVASWTAVGGNADAGTFNEFVYQASSTVSVQQIKVAYTNDVYSPPVDYNLRIDKIQVDSTQYESEAPSTYSTGTYVPENGQVLPGYWKSEWLHSNGYFQYDRLIAQHGSLGLEASSIATRENNGSVTVAVLRSSGSDGTVSIDYKINQGTAEAGSDYTTSSGTLVFQPGEIRRAVSIPLINDSIGESPETFSFVIENPQGGATLMAPRTATITITDDDLVLPNYTSFPSSAGLKLNGNATITNSTLELTPNTSSRRGSAFHTTAIPIKLDTSFQTQFQFVTLGTTTGGEGLTFMLQNDSRGTSALGSGGAGLGYSGILNSLAVEFDTVQGSGEVNANHVSIWRNGSMSTSLATQASSIDFNSGQPVNVWIDYHGDKDLLSVYISSTTTKPTSPVASATVDITTLVGSQAFFGFSAATSSLANAHRITSWTMNQNRPSSGTNTTPPTLVNQTIAVGLKLPTAVEFDSSGRLYVAEKQGRVVVVQDGVTFSTPFIDISSQTNSASDRGLLDLALHPNFPATPYVYLLYTFDPAEVYQNSTHEFAGPDKTGNRAGRLIRVTADAATNYTTAVAGSEVVLLGKNSTWNHFNGFINSTTNIDAPPGGVDANGNYVQDFIASDSESHTVADLAFAPDGSLYVAIGDGASYNTVDPRAVRVQHVDSLSGKILRINPIDGRGYASNPFSDGNLDSNRSKVYQLGLRNPFRISVDAASGRLYIGDVGWTQWEEIDSGAAGANFGWPYYEGASGTNQRTPGYESLPEAQAFYASGAVVTPSLYALNHAADGINAIIMGAYYTGTTYPSQYQGSLFFNDLGQGIVRTAKLDAAGKVTSIETFATGATYVVQITQGPDGNLYYVDLDDGIIGRWQFVSEPAPTSSTSSTSESESTSTSTSSTSSSPSSESIAVQSTMPSSGASDSTEPSRSPVAAYDTAGKRNQHRSAAGSQWQRSITAEMVTAMFSEESDVAPEDLSSQSLIARVKSKLVEAVDLTSKLRGSFSRK